MGQERFGDTLQVVRGPRGGGLDVDAGASEGVLERLACASLIEHAGQEVEECRAWIVGGGQRTSLLDEPVEGADDDRLEEGLLGGEVTVNRTDAHPARRAIS